MLLLLIELNRSCFFCKTLINSSTFNVSVVNKICVTKQIVGINYSPPGPLVTPDTWHSFWPLCDPLIFMLSFKVFCFHAQSVTHFSLFMCLTIIKRSQITSVSRWEWRGGWTRLEGRLPWLSKGSLTPMKLDPGVEGVERSATWTRCFLAFPTKHTARHETHNPSKHQDNHNVNTIRATFNTTESGCCIRSSGNK